MRDQISHYSSMEYAFIVFAKAGVAARAGVIYVGDTYCRRPFFGAAHRSKKRIVYVMSNY